MRVFSGFSRATTWGFALLLPSTLVACSSDDAASTTDLAALAPHCPGGTDALKIEGSIADGVISDTRSTNINAGLENLGAGKFYTPVTDLAPLAGNQLALSVSWTRSLAYGESASIGSGTLQLPATHPKPGAVYCVSAGEVGFVEGGAEDGVFKFAITEVKAGADCSGATEAVDLRGCFE